METLHWSVFLAYSVSLLLGYLIGVLELACRYRDAPFSSCFTLPGFIYSLINALVSVLSLFLLRLYSLGPEPDPHDSIIAQSLSDVFYASFGSAVIFRSVVVNVKDKAGDKEEGFGLNFLVLRLLHIVDRAVDRRRAATRTKEIHEICKGLSFDDVSHALYKYCFRLMQNVPVEEWKKVEECIKDQEDFGINVPEEVKAVNVTLEIYNIVGYKALKKSVESLKDQGTIGQDTGHSREAEKESYLLRLKTKAKTRESAQATPATTPKRQSEDGQRKPQDDDNG